MYTLSSDGHPVIAPTGIDLPISCCRCRSGDLCSKHDLLRVSVDRARSVVILNAAVVGGDGVAHARQALPIALQVRSILDETTGDINAANTHASPQVVVEVECGLQEWMVIAYCYVLPAYCGSFPMHSCKFSWYSCAFPWTACLFALKAYNSC